MPLTASAVLGIPRACANKASASLKGGMTTVAEAIAGYIVRVCIFQLAEHGSVAKRFFMRIYRILASEPSPGPIDPERLNRTKKILETLGGIEAVVKPADGSAQIHLMTFKAAAFDRAIDQLGGQIDRTAQVILPKSDTSKETFDRLCDMLRKLEPDKVNRKIPLPKAPAGTVPMVVHFHSPGRSMMMDTHWILTHLAAGYDICVSDLRGTMESTGVPTEGGYYLDAEAIFQHVLNQGYAPDKIWLSGYCEGAAVAAHLKAKYHAQGVHLVIQNTFHSATDLIKGYGWLGRTLAPYGIQALQSKDPAITTLVKQDGFSLEEKFQHLPPTTGQFFVVTTDTDRTVPPDSPTRIQKAIGSAGPFTQYEHKPHDRKSNGHTPVPTQSTPVWNRYVEVVNLTSVATP